MPQRNLERIRPALAYHALTPLFDVVVELMGYGPEFQRRVIRTLDPRPGESVLDLGCGTGTLLRELALVPRARLVIGVEPDSRALRQTSAKLSGLSSTVMLVQSLGQALPLRDESVDRVVCTLVFHHLPTPVKRATAREVQRVLRRGGHLLLADYGPPANPLGALVLRLAGTLDGWSGMEANFHGQVPDILRDAGLQVEEKGRLFRGVSFLLATKATA
ncbi:MAG: class I SAM-dependent methyltransferase [Chloroflexota bacterium]